MLGGALGCIDGRRDGLDETGCLLGVLVGMLLGTPVGPRVGAEDTGCEDGILVGCELLGLRVGNRDGC